MRTSPGREAALTPSSVPRVGDGHYNMSSEQICSGNYSKKLFVGLGYTQLKAVNYDEFRDEQGQLYLQDTREHIAATTFCKQL